MKGFWEKLFGSRSSSPPAPPANDGEDDVLSEVRAQIRRDLIAGFDDTKTIIQSAVEVFESDVEPSILENHARLCFDEELAAHTARQSTWPKTTDCDRLDAAFVALEKSGVISRQHFSCCGNCGSTEIWGEIADVQEAGGQARGYTFFHVQDTEAAVDGHGLCLNYGACEEGEAAAIAIGHDIVTELERHGLTTDWNGSWDRRIGVALDWKRRRTG
jgi:hypothetical protein